MASRQRAVWRPAARPESGLASAATEGGGGGLCADVKGPTDCGDSGFVSRGGRFQLGIVKGLEARGPGMIWG